MKTLADTVTLRWKGHAWLSPGIAVFYGRSGHQDWHHHQAHQIALGIESSVTVETPEGSEVGDAVFVPAGVQHRLSGNTIISVYLDVLSDEARALPDTKLGQIEVDTADVRVFTEALNSTGEIDLELRFGVRRILRLTDPPLADSRLSLVSAALRGGLMGRDELAALVHLSPTRFSHWFVEQTGLPLRSYAKWLRLTHAIQLLAGGWQMTNAAHEAGFSDSAHFSRTFRALLGIDPSSALAEVRLRND
ncbi:AraC family transcriptional regulator [Thioalkalivibrio sulfidiphilus]